MHMHLPADDSGLIDVLAGGKASSEPELTGCRDRSLLWYRESSLVGCVLYNELSHHNALVFGATLCQFPSPGMHEPFHDIELSSLFLYEGDSAILEARGRYRQLDSELRANLNPDEELESAKRDGQPEDYQAISTDLTTLLKPDKSRIVIAQRELGRAKFYFIGGARFSYVNGEHRLAEGCAALVETDLARASLLTQRLQEHLRRPNVL